MKLWKKILIVAVGLLVLAQIPFVYRRIQYSRRAEMIAKTDSVRTVRTLPGRRELKGVIHIHTNIGGHSTGTFDELIEAAEKNGLDFVLMTEHTAALYDTAALTLKGKYKNVLFVSGQEVETISGDRFLMIPGGPEVHGDALLETPKFLEKYHARNQIALITYPERFKTWSSAFDGIEVFSLHTNAKTETPVYALGDLFWSFRSYPELVFAEWFRRPDENLKRFDEAAKTRRVTLFGGTDAHSNIGFHLLGDDAGNRLLSIKLDRYETILRLVRAHVLIPDGAEANQDTVIAAVRNGNLFVGFDVFGDSSGFGFAAGEGPGAAIMGDEIVLRDGLTGRAAAPVPARFVVFRDGEAVGEWKSTSEIAFEIREPGAYRVEVYREELGGELASMPWIISNPIYVRRAN